jgi:Domain of unknown function (DUF6265)
VYRFRLGVLLSFAVGAALALFASSPTGFAQQSKRAASQTNGAQTAPPDAAASQTPLQSLPDPKLSDFAWLEGRWRGDWGPRVAEQVWTAPQAGMMLGDFRLIENDKVLVLEFFSLVENPSGIKFYFRHFTPELVPWEKSVATQLNLASAEAKKFEFENPASGMPKRAIFTRIDADTYTARSELVPESGEPQVIEITYHRQPLAAVVPNSAAGAHPKKK